MYAAYNQYNQVYNPETTATVSRYLPFVARPEAFAVKVPSFFVSGLATAAAAPLMLVGLQTYTDLVNIGNHAQARLRVRVMLCRQQGCGHQPHHDQPTV